MNYDKTQIKHTALYRGKYYEILDVNEPEQLLQIGRHLTDMSGGEEPQWVRAENCEYIPF